MSSDRLYNMIHERLRERAESRIVGLFNQLRAMVPPNVPRITVTVDIDYPPIPIEELLHLITVKLSNTLATAGVEAEITRLIAVANSLPHLRPMPPDSDGVLFQDVDTSDVKW